jgi:hypothetical protein
MSGNELRDRLAHALSGLEGDTGPVRRLVFEMADQLKARSRALADLEKQVQDHSARIAQLGDRVNGQVVTMESLAQRHAQATAARAALEGEVAALRAAPVVLLGEVFCRETGQTYRLDDALRIDQAVADAAGAKIRLCRWRYEADTVRDVEELQRMWRALDLTVPAGQLPPE